LIVKKEFSDKLRPGYGAKELLVEVEKIGKANDFIFIFTENKQQILLRIGENLNSSHALF
jgi:hypothetical protein